MMKTQIPLLLPAAPTCTWLAPIKWTVMLLTLLIGASVSTVRAEERVRVAIPTKEQVGAARMPDEIAPVKAPFPMPEFKKPKFPALTVKITEHGAKENEMATKSIQAAIDAVSSKGGGTVIIPAGKWLTGRISLKNNVNLNVAQGAEVTFSGNIEDYRPAVFTRSAGFEVMSLGALIYANGQTNIALTGKGKLTGPPRDCPIQKQSIGYGSLDKLVTAKFGTPVAERVYEGYDGSPVFLPTFITPINCTNVYIEGVTLERTAFWNIVPVYCDGVIIRGVTVNSVGIPMGDGMDIESSRNVLIEYSTLNCGDDCFTLKAGRNEDGMRINRPTENIVIRFCLSQKGHGGITLGSETAGMIRNVYLQDCVFDGTGTGIRFKTRRPRGGGGENVILERIRMDVGTAITADMLGSTTYVGALAKRTPLPINEMTPAYRNVRVTDLIVEKASQFVKITGIPESPFSNFLLENADVNCDKLIKITDATGFTIKNAAIQSGDAVIDLLDARNLTFDNVSFKVPGDEVIAKLQGDATANIRFQNCTPEKPKGWENTSR